MGKVIKEVVGETSTVDCGSVVVRGDGYGYVGDGGLGEDRTQRENGQSSTK